MYALLILVSLAAANPSTSPKLARDFLKPTPEGNLRVDMDLIRQVAQENRQLAQEVDQILNPPRDRSR
jgi:hypothetical protein